MRNPRPSAPPVAELGKDAMPSTEVADDIWRSCEAIGIEDSKPEKRFLHSVGGVAAMQMLQSLAKLAKARFKKDEGHVAGDPAYPNTVALGFAVGMGIQELSKLPESHHDGYAAILALEEKHVSGLACRMLQQAWDAECGHYSSAAEAMEVIEEDWRKATEETDVIDEKVLLSLAKSPPARAIFKEWGGVRMARASYDDSYLALAAALPSTASHELKILRRRLVGGRQGARPKAFISMVASFLTAQVVYKPSSDPSVAIDAATAFQEEHSPNLPPKLSEALASKRDELAGRKAS